MTWSSPLQDLNPLQIATVFGKFRADIETPVSLYLKLAKDRPYNFILESVEHGEHAGRFSYVGWDLFLHLSYRPGLLKISGAVDAEIVTEQPLEHLKTLISKIDMMQAFNLPSAHGGFVGYFGYDSIRLIEDIGPIKSSSTPWIELMIPSSLLVLDHKEQIVTLYCHEPLGEEGEDQACHKANRRLKRVAEKIRTLAVSNDFDLVDNDPVTLDAWTSNLSKEAFCGLVEKAKQHIYEGDIFQVVLSRAIRRGFGGDPFYIYRNLRGLNPSPYMFYLHFDGLVTVGGSPESLVTLDKSLLTTKPIAGTRPRGKSLEEDLALEKELLADQKEIAEHVMLVDLGRNDLGRIAKSGSVNVPKFKTIERYSHVMHIVSIVQAMLRDDMKALDALMSVFPAGTLSGAPKISAMQIINDFEPEGRGIYGGAICLLDFYGNLDSCIAIRTAVIENGQVRIQAGAGIVADSVPEREYDETTQKMMSMITAVERAMRQQNS